MRRPTIPFVHLVVIAALAVGSGVHWIALQSVAWATMLVDYSREASLVVAVEKTFDGQHPCALCLTVKDGEKQQQEQQAAQPLPDIKGILAPVLRVTSPAFVFTSHPRYEEAAEKRAHSPPVPPPRLAQVTSCLQGRLREAACASPGGTADFARAFPSLRAAP